MLGPFTSRSLKLVRLSWSRLLCDTVAGITWTTVAETTPSCRYTRSRENEPIGARSGRKRICAVPRSGLSGLPRRIAT